MKLGTITTTNTKGQIVIPKKMRSALGITEHVLLNIILTDHGLAIYPIGDFPDKSAPNTAYSQLLNRTKGAWGAANIATDAVRTVLELDASKRRKQTW